MCNVTKFQNCRSVNTFFIGKKPSQKHSDKHNMLQFPVYSLTGPLFFANFSIFTHALANKPWNRFSYDIHNRLPSKDFSQTIISQGLFIFPYI